MDYKNVLGEHKFPTYEELKNGLLRLIDEGKISREDAARLIPELRESEDERVIRTLYYLVRDHDWVNGATKGEALIWLEKQKEQKPVEWSEEDEILRVRTINRLETLNFHGISGKEIRESIDWLKSIRPSWKPSEEQMKVLDEAFMKSDNEKYRQTISSLYYDLKNL